MDPKNLVHLFKKINQFDRHFGLSFTVDGPGLATYELIIADQHLSSPGVAHGAVVAAMMDAQLGITALSLAVIDHQLCSTVELKTNFLQPAKLGDHLIGIGEVDFKGKSLIVVSAKIQHKTSGELIARGMGTFNLYPMTKKELSIGGMNL